MQRKSIRLINKLGLHARAAMKLSALAARYQCTILIRYKNHEINAKSILNVMALAATCGSELEVSTDGTDEQEAMSKITALIEDRFGEDE